MEQQVSGEVISSEIEKYIEDIGALRDEYKQCYETMKEIEKKITVKAGAISALKALVETVEVADEPAADISGETSLNSEGEAE